MQVMICLPGVGATGIRIDLLALFFYRVSDWRKRYIQGEGYGRNFANPAGSGSVCRTAGDSLRNPADAIIINLIVICSAIQAISWTA